MIVLQELATVHNVFSTGLRQLNERQHTEWLNLMRVLGEVLLVHKVCTSSLRYTTRSTASSQMVAKMLFKVSFVFSKYL